MAQLLLSQWELGQRDSEAFVEALHQTKSAGIHLVDAIGRYPKISGWLA